MLQRMLLRPLEAAEVLGIGRTKVYDLIHRGEIPSIRFDGSIRIPTDQLRETIARKASTSAAAIAEVAEPVEA